MKRPVGYEIFGWTKGPRMRGWSWSGRMTLTHEDRVDDDPGGVVGHILPQVCNTKLSNCVPANMILG